MPAPKGQPLWLSAIALLAFVGGAVCLYVLVYRPARGRRVRVEQEHRGAQGRVDRLEARIRRLRERNEGFEQGDPEVRGESMREHLRLVEHGETVIPGAFRARNGEGDA